MAKVSLIQRNKKRQMMAKSLNNKRQRLKAVVYDKKLSLNERFLAVTALAQMSRNSARSRVRNRCALTGRPRGYCRQFSLSRNMFERFCR